MNTLDLTEDTRRYMKGMEILLEHPEMRLLHYIPTVERPARIRRISSSRPDKKPWNPYRAKRKAGKGR